MTADEHRRKQQAAELDDLARVPDDVLSDLVARRGLCLWEITSGDPPAWTGQGLPDRELAARLCAGCPVRRECLERGMAIPFGVFGGLTPEERRLRRPTSATRGRVFPHTAAEMEPASAGRA